MFQQLVLASGNQGKLTELAQLLAGLSISMQPQSVFGVQDAEETGRSFVENALIKARHACEATGLPALADDSGLVVPALGGAPGIHSSRYAGNSGDAVANNAKLLAAMRDFSGEQRSCYFYCVLALMRHTDDPTPLIAEGRLHGCLAASPAGENGFGYDPLVCLPGSDTRIAQLTDKEKNRISHRGQALNRLLERLKQEA